MKLTYNEVLQANDALKELQGRELPLKVSLDIALLMNTIESQIKAFGVVRDKLFKTYSINTEPDKDEGKIRFVSTEKGKEEANLLAFMEEFNELLESKVEFADSLIRLPQEIATTCESCNKKVERGLEIKPGILKPLTKLVEVE